MTDGPEPSARARAERVNDRYRPVDATGHAVTRVASAETSTVHAFLRHLRAQGLKTVPEPLGLDGGIETLSYIEGDSGGDAWQHQQHDQGLRSAAWLLREIHDASRSWRPPPDATFNAPPVDHSGDEVVFCHGDPGPWNFVWRDGHAVGLIDWDFLHPAPRLDDVTYALFWFAPMRADNECVDWHHFRVVPDRRARVQSFLAAYGELPEFDVVAGVADRRRATVRQMQAMATLGIEPQRTWVADGLVEQELAEIRWLEANRSMFGD